MNFEAWHFTAMEEAGYTTTSEGLNNRLANYLIKNGSDNIDSEEFANACLACNIDVNTVTKEDLDYIQEKLNKYT